MKSVRVATGDTSRIAFGQGTFASRITSTAGPAVLEAGQAMKDLVFAAATAILHADMADLEFVENRVCVRGKHDHSLTLQEIAQLSNMGKHGITMKPGVPAALETTSYFTPERAAYASGAHAAIVDVDPETGEVDIVSYVIGHDCGSVINPQFVDGQVSRRALATWTTPFLPPPKCRPWNSTMCTHLAP